RDTLLMLTPTRSAMSFMVGRLGGRRRRAGSPWLPGGSSRVSTSVRLDRPTGTVCTTSTLTVIVDVAVRSRVSTSIEAADRTGPSTGEQIAVVVPHVHWDREWYEPFEVMRFHLVRFLDELVDTLEAEPDLPAFLLDGQAVIVEDYLEVRRAQRDRLTALVRAGRLRPGPFYVQPDEFHVSGEGLVRNLLIGCRVSAELGWVMREGYLPDTFGHVHQLPQILRGFGISTFYAMRGFGQDVDE